MMKSFLLIHLDFNVTVPPNRDIKVISEASYYIPLTTH